MICIGKKILLFLFFSAMLWAEKPTPTLKELPTPFCFFEDLYYVPKTSTFVVLNNPDLTKRAIDMRETRGYAFKNTHRPLKHAQKVAGTTLFLFEGLGSTCCTYHFFHILEHIVGDWAYYGDRYSEDVKLIVIASAGETARMAWEGPNRINKHVLRALFPNAEVQTWVEFRETFQKVPYCFERVLTSDRRISYRDPECQRLNRMLGFARHSLPQEALQKLADRVNAYAGTKINDEERLRVTFLKRSPPRTLDPTLEEKLLSSIRMMGNASLRVEDFATLPFKKQVNIIGNTDVLISVHGNGLSHSLFLPPGAKVIEIFPPDTHTVDYRIFAEARGLDYTCIMSNRGIISQEESYQTGAYGNFSQTIYDLDIPLVLREIGGNR
ncbi:MAG: glycosyltransferase family 61 protein [Chlamydiales bacterium]